MLNKLKDKKGFTLIEIVLVLAIAGLIMVIVFLAVSGAQKARRDTQRKNDANRILAAFEQYAGNTNGTYPAPANATALMASYITNTSFEDPLNGFVYGTGGTAGNVTFTASGNPTPPSSTAAAGVVFTQPGGSRTVKICIGQEQAVGYCATNQ